MNPYFHRLPLSRCLVSILLLALVVPACRAQQATGARQAADAPRQAMPAPTPARVDAAQLLDDVKQLSSDAMEGRKTGTQGGARAREYVAQRFKQTGLKPFGDSYFKPFSFKGKDGKQYRAANVVGYVEGKTDPRRFLLVTAHYDHLGVVGGKIYNGADDNASGTAALLALAAYFAKHPPANSIILAALDGEEEGLKGAWAFVANPPVELKSIVLDVNMDMVSHNDRGELYVAGTHQYPFLRPHVERVAGRAGIKLLLGHDRPDLPRGEDWTMQSDQGVFHHTKIPFLYLGVEDHKDYHKPTDDFENLNRDFYPRAVETIVDLVRELDQNLPAIAAARAK